jgi:hypothetical protein
MCLISGGAGLGWARQFMAVASRDAAWPAGSPTSEEAFATSAGDAARSFGAAAAAGRLCAEG